MGGLAIFGVGDVNQAPVPGFFAVDLSFDAVSGYGRFVFAHLRVKNPVEFRLRCIPVEVDLYSVCLKIASRKHAAHYVLKDMLLDEPVDSRNI
jgi:hypothetical protein